MIHCVYGHDAEVASWVGFQIGVKDFGKCVAIGIANNQQIIGGAVYSHFYNDQWGKPLSIEMAFATIDKRWAIRGIISQLLDYPFGQLNVERVQLTTMKRNKEVRRFVERLGFKLEGIARKAHHTRTDACLYSLLRNEWNESTWAKVHLQHRQHQIRT